jgi:hypothetical protein
MITTTMSSNTGHLLSSSACSVWLVKMRMETLAGGKDGRVLMGKQGGFRAPMLGVCCWRGDGGRRIRISGLVRSNES